MMSFAEIGDSNLQDLSTIGSGRIGREHEGRSGYYTTGIAVQF